MCDDANGTHDDFTVQNGPLWQLCPNNKIKNRAQCYLETQITHRIITYLIAYVVLCVICSHI